MAATIPSVRTGGAPGPRAGGTRRGDSSGDTRGRDQSPLDLVKEDLREGGDGGGAVSKHAPQTLRLELQSFKEFPPRQKPGSFNLERVMEAVMTTPGSGR